MSENTTNTQIVKETMGNKENQELLGNNEYIVRQLRMMTANLYDRQKMRIEAGNRLVASFYDRLGYEPSEKTEEEEGASNKFIEKIKAEAKAVREYMNANNCREETAIKALNKEPKTKLEILRDKTDYGNVESQMLLEQSEERLVKDLERVVKTHPLYEKFFSHVKGCGPMMSAVLLSYLNPYKAKYVSSFYKYCGLDTVHDKDKDGNIVYLTKEEFPRKVIEKYVFHTADGKLYEGDTKDIKETDAYFVDGDIIYEDAQHNQYRKEQVMKDGNPVYTVIEGADKTDYTGDVTFSEHGRRKGDTEMFPYKDKEGKEQMKRGITYNPILKSKIIGVLSGTIKKAKDPVYCGIYMDYRKKLDNDPKYRDYTPGHKHNMALRYMMKQFLRNLWVTWRAMEGLEIAEPFEVAKLGMKPHKFNEYHYNMARIRNGEAAINYTGEPNVYDYSTYVDGLYDKAE